MEHLESIAMAINLLGVVVIGYGVLYAVVKFLLTEATLWRGEDVTVERARLRHGLGYYLLMGLEILIAADIVETILATNRDQLLELAVIVVLRTVLSYSLGRELSELEHLLEEREQADEVS